MEPIRGPKKHWAKKMVLSYTDPATGQHRRLLPKMSIWYEQACFAIFPNVIVHHTHSFILLHVVQGITCMFNFLILTVQGSRSCFGRGSACLSHCSRSLYCSHNNHQYSIDGTKGELMRLALNLLFCHFFFFVLFGISDEVGRSMIFPRTRALVGKSSDYSFTSLLFLGVPSYTINL